MITGIHLLEAGAHLSHFAGYIRQTYKSGQTSSQLEESRPQDPNSEFEEGQASVQGYERQESRTPDLGDASSENPGPDQNNESIEIQDRNQDREAAHTRDSDRRSDAIQRLSFSGVSTDTRKIEEGQLFVCLKGPNFDAHDFVASAVEMGATGILIESHREQEVIQTLAGSAISDAKVNLFLCEDPLTTLQNLARVHRRNQPYKVIAVTGSNGKTSAKEMLLGMLIHLLGSESVDATKGNLNNHIGVPLTLLNLKPGISHAIIEMGMNHAGEIDLLSSIAEPDHGLITSVGRAHIEFFYSKRGIARAKQELLYHCKSSLSYPASAIGKSLLYRRNPAGGFRGSGTRAPVIALFGMEDEPGWQSVPDAAKNSRWKRIRGLNLRFGPGGLEFKLREDGYEGTVENPHYYSRVQAENLLGCISTLLMAGFSTESVREAARHAAPVSGGRFHILRKDDRILVDDTYNANPDSFLAAIASLRKMLPHGRLLCLAGQMAELGSAGEAGHNEVGHALKLDEYSLQVVGSEGALSYLQGYGIHYRSGQIQKTDSEGNELKAGSSPVVGGASPMTGSLGRDSGADFSADPEKENGQGNVDNRDSDLRFFFPDSAELADHIERHSQFYLSFDGILAKGSRSARMEKACEALKRIGYV